MSPEGGNDTEKIVFPSCQCIEGFEPIPGEFDGQNIDFCTKVDFKKTLQ